MVKLMVPEKAPLNTGWKAGRCWPGPPGASPPPIGAPLPPGATPPLEGTPPPFPPLCFLSFSLRSSPLATPPPFPPPLFLQLLPEVISLGYTRRDLFPLPRGILPPPLQGLQLRRI